MTRKEIKEFYEKRFLDLSEKSRMLKCKNRWFVAAELSAFILASASAVYYFTAGRQMLFILLAALLFVLYFIVRYVDVKNGNTIKSLDAHCDVYAKELEYMSGCFSGFDDGSRYVDSKHQYSFDMDLFGPQSLYNRICRTVTGGGSDKLAALLNNCALEQSRTQRNAASIDAHRKSVDELAGMEEWRTKFLSLKRQGKIDTAAIGNVIEAAGRMSDFRTTASVPALICVAASITLLVVLLILFVFFNLNVEFVLDWVFIQMMLSLLFNARALRQINKSVSRLCGEIQPCLSLIGLISKTSFEAENNKACVRILAQGEISAVDSFKELKGILDALNRRGNVLALMLFNAICCSDFFLVRRYLRWKEKSLSQMEKWLDVVCEMDARVSMATFRYNEPESVAATIVDDDKVIYEAKGIYHPFLGEKAVCNDFNIMDGNYYIITGANMAGKSTFLRSLGVNYILAMCGMPVFASSLRVSVYDLFSSMRTTDDLAHGISYFNAELLRLRDLIDNVKHSERTLIILDEILKGTNSLDKQNGSRMFLEAISKLPVSGIIATHDLELSKMEDWCPGRFHNYCFEIKLSDEISYTYKITPGVAQNQNASYLLKRMLDFS